MSHISKRLIACLLLLVLTLSLFACNDTGESPDACEHEFSSWGVLKQATCFEEGFRARSCALCEEVQSEAIPVRHRFSDGVCTECGTPEQTDNGGGEGGGELDPACDHKDENADKICDLCNVSTIVVIDFYALNDLHGKIFDTETQPGVDELTTYLKNAYVTDDHVVVLSSGDMWQGSSESNLTHGHIMTEWMMEVGTVSMTFGNHEFDWSGEYIYENLEIADFPFLAINIYETATNTRADYATPSVIVERGGARIGIIGAIGNCYSSISRDKVMDVEFKTGAALTALVMAESQRLREAGCDLIVYSIHDGLSMYGNVGTVSDHQFASYYDTVLSNGYVDVVFEGHSHSNYVCTDEKGVYHVQAGGENDAISHIELTVDVISDDVTVRTAETVRSGVYDDCADDPVVETLREKYADKIAKGDEILGQVDTFTDGDLLRQVCADQYLAYGLEEWGDSYTNIVLAGGYIGIRSPYDLYPGTVRYKDVYELFPFDNALCLCTVSGAKLLSQFINTSNSNYFICYSNYGASLNIQRDATYYVITDTYSAYYAPNGLTIAEMLEEEIFARDMIAQYIKDGGLGDTAPTPTPTPTPTPDPVLPEIKTVAEIKAIIDGLGANVESAEEYYVKVTIVDTPQSTYGNCNVRDEAGDVIYVYGLKDANGNQYYQHLAEKPQAGDTVLLLGKVMYYKNNTGEEKYEIIAAKIIDIL